MKSLVIILIISFFSIFAQDSTHLTPIIPDFQVNEDDSTSKGPPSIAVNAEGNFTILWIDELDSEEIDTTFNFDIKIQKYLSDGTALGDNIKVEDSIFVYSKYFIGGYFYPSYDINRNGQAVISWENESDIYAHRFLSDGAMLGSHFKVNEDEGRSKSTPKVALDGDGNFIITWIDIVTSNIYVQRYLSDGSTSGGNFQINDQDGSVVRVNIDFPEISVNENGNFVILWEEKSGIYVQQFTNNGEA